MAQKHDGLSSTDLAALFDVSVSTVQRWAAKGLPHWKQGGTKLRFAKQAAQAWVKEERRKALARCGR